MTSRGITATLRRPLRPAGRPARGSAEAAPTAPAYRAYRPHGTYRAFLPHLSNPPHLPCGFFLTAGVGVGTVSYADESESGLGVLIGIGWDVRLGRNISLTPFYNGYAMRNDTTDANVGQIGIGVTFH